LLQYGFLVLEPAAPSPVVLPKAERLRQWRTRRAAERAQAAAIPADLLSVKEAAARLQITEPAVRSAIRRKLVQATRRPEQPGRTFVAVAEVERYRKERLGQVGRTRTPGLAEERERQFQARLDAFRAEHEAARA
jgi:hypothetical protein